MTFFTAIWLDTLAMAPRAESEQHLGPNAYPNLGPNVYTVYFYFFFSPPVLRTSVSELAQVSR